jgi:hypothetical protein
MKNILYLNIKLIYKTLNYIYALGFYSLNLQ